MEWPRPCDDLVIYPGCLIREEQRAIIEWELQECEKHSRFLEEQAAWDD